MGASSGGRGDAWAGAKIETHRLLFGISDRSIDLFLLFICALSSLLFKTFMIFNKQHSFICLLLISFERMKEGINDLSFCHVRTYFPQWLSRCVDASVASSQITPALLTPNDTPFLDDFMYGSRAVFLSVAITDLLS